MAISKKYAGLPDLDPAPEVYETPDLADDVSTVQTGTERTGTPSPSDEENAHLDRRPIDRHAARKRFEPTVINARNVDFSDTIATGQRASYKAKSRRRSRQKRDVDQDTDSSESEEESLGRRIARLKREAEEVRLLLQERNGDNIQGTVGAQDNNEHIEDTVDELTTMINGLYPPRNINRKQVSPDEPANDLPSGPASKQSGEELDKQLIPKTNLETSTNAAIAAFSDRLTALETSLGLSQTDTSSQPLAILPTLASLSANITNLNTTLAPSKLSSTSPSSSSAYPNLDALSLRVKALTAESDRLSQSRKAALQSLNDLHEARLRNPSNRPSSSHRQSTNTSNGEAALHSILFLDEQSSKITALYRLLPTIQNLQPLLPVVLERLRTLSIVHAGAADAKAELEEVQRRQIEMAEEVAKWRDAVEGVEKGMKTIESSTKGNVEVVNSMMKDVEVRVQKLSKGR